METTRYLTRAVELACKNVSGHGGNPFGAVIVKEGKVIAEGVNDVAATSDPTAHAEIQAIRSASKTLETSDLSGCTVYASGQPCPMCLSAMYFSKIKEVYFAYSNEDAEPFGFSTAPIYKQLALPIGQQSLPIWQAEAEDAENPYELFHKLKE
ncbi:nucleoside deaminase [Bacillus sp. FJAT-42376]|uniref:nucleoside deaminase n=1 Tax=Bacillus sp. FJAT-42376 TaxID=2014076 RepID=UPI000F4F050A|nr:nucleoside deaminase [Bacillus sp. FJAT-42376]AZB42103.1 nucleoside deaminase [Bacillus sp. FJAT-42376]